MKRAIILTAVHVVFVLISASATIINVPDDYDTIQEGIDASSHGDTVLVEPGTYVENINFNGHNIVLGSLFLMTGDTTYIAETIVDGDLSGTAVIFASGEDSTAAIKGFTVQNGISIEGGGGIHCQNSSPLIVYNTIRNNSTYG